MKIIKPLTLGVLQRPYRYRGQHRLSIAALGFFRLGQGATDRLLTENLQWAKLIPYLPLGVPLDYMQPKARAEVMLSGAAHAVAEPVKEMTVRLQCGKVDKSLRVIGKRSWRRTLIGSLCISEAEAFKRLPLHWENAYGGADYPANPLGRGYLPRWASLRQKTGEMPNIETPANKLKPGRKTYVPAGFAPVNLLHSPMRIRSGTYNQQWLDEDFPGLPRDFDFALYNLTPRDQQFDGRFQGNESYVLEGLHPQQSVLKGTLPGIAARAFVQRKGQAPDAAEEVPLACDTVWFFPELDVGMLIYRGETRVEDSDALDIASLMVAYEKIGAQPRPLSHYREVMSLRLDAQTAGLHAFNESQLAPPRSAAQIAARTEARAQQAAAQLAERQAVLDEQMAEFRQHSGLTPPADYTAPRLNAPTLNGPSADEVAEGEFELSELQAQANALAASVKRDFEAKLAELQQTQNDAMPQPTLTEVTRKVLDQARQIAHDLLDGPAPPEQTSVPAMQRAARNAAPSPTLAAPLPDAAALALRRLVQQCLRDGISLAGRDLAGACLAELDMRGLDLREVQLERADLRGASFVGADLSKATLTAANLSGADFSQANLDDANLCSTQAQATRFCGATLRGARAMDADWNAADLHGVQLADLLATGINLSNARLDDSHLLRSILSDAKAAGGSWRNTQWQSSVATGIDLASADFSGAALEKSVLMDGNLKASNWREAKLLNVYAGGKANWEGANLHRARFSRSSLHGARLVGVNFQQGIFAQSDFGEADLSDAQMDDARFYRSLFMQSRLRRVRGQRTDFFQALCRKTDFSQAQLREANLVHTDMAEAILQGSDLGGASVSQKARLK